MFRINHNNKSLKKGYKVQNKQPDKIKTEDIVKAILRCDPKHLSIKKVKTIIRLVPSELLPVLYCKVLHWKNPIECHHLLNILSSEWKSNAGLAICVGTVCLASLRLLDLD